MLSIYNQNCIIIQISKQQYIFYFNSYTYILIVFLYILPANTLNYIFFKAFFFNYCVFRITKRKEKNLTPFNKVGDPSLLNYTFIYHPIHVIFNDDLVSITIIRHNYSFWCTHFIFLNYHSIYI